MTATTTIAAMASGVAQAPSRPTKRSAYSANVIATAAIAPHSIIRSSAQP